MQMFNVHQAKSQLSKLIALALAGEEVVIANAGKPSVQLSPITRVKKTRTLGKFKGKIHMSADFDDESDEINKLFYGS